MMMSALRPLIEKNDYLWWHKIRTFNRLKMLFRLKEFSKNYVFPHIGQHLETLRSKKKSDQLFIFGGGASIASYTEGDWEKIKSKDTMAVNDSIILPIIPDFYFLEAGCRDSLIYNLFQRESDLQNTAILYRQDSVFAYFRKQVPLSLKKNIYLYSHMTPRFASEYRMKYYYRKAYEQNLHLDAIHSGLLIDGFSSIVRAIHFGVLLGYKEIILCGVDLNNGRYFYDEMAKNLEAKGYRIPINSLVNQSGVHNTVDKSRRAITTDMVLYSVIEDFASPLGAKVMTFKNTSLLNPRVPSFS